ncbi:DUF465 domain-containing protein [Afifella sp. H1R]|nr:MULTISPECIES: DUF465 domain-containing protein [Afifella]MCF1504157.1 DUF465 domain-containing protein [Afifella sp. H1R]MCT8268148.1 DUF465 domain-containing protein [Afifella sp. JA880]
MMDGSDNVVELTQKEIRAELALLRQEHRDLDHAIEALHTASPQPDYLQLQRLKRKKLSLKDRILALEDRLLPDIIA